MLSAETDGELDFDTVAAMYPAHEIVTLQYDVPTAAFPQGFSCFIKIPKAKIAAGLRPDGPPLFWRHGETIHVKAID